MQSGSTCQPHSPFCHHWFTNLWTDILYQTTRWVFQWLGFEDSARVVFQLIYKVKKPYGTVPLVAFPLNLGYHPQTLSASFQKSNQRNDTINSSRTLVFQSCFSQILNYFFLEDITHKFDHWFKSFPLHWPEVPWILWNQHQKQFELLLLKSWFLQNLQSNFQKIPKQEWALRSSCDVKGCVSQNFSVKNTMLVSCEQTKRILSFSFMYFL